jgi:hypothetical protein
LAKSGNAYSLGKNHFLGTWVTLSHELGNRFSEAVIHIMQETVVNGRRA